MIWTSLPFRRFLHQSPRWHSAAPHTFLLLWLDRYNSHKHTGTHFKTSCILYLVMTRNQVVRFIRPEPNDFRVESREETSPRAFRTAKDTTKTKPLLYLFLSLYRLHVCCSFVSCPLFLCCLLFLCTIQHWLGKVCL